MQPHPGYPAKQVTGITARWVAQAEHWVRLRWRIEGSAALCVPPMHSRTRADGLWRTTCFELFVATGAGEGYQEWNLSPSRRWVGYQFSKPRDGGSDIPVHHSPSGTFRPGRSFAIFDADLPRSALPRSGARCGITAVIEEQGGVMSYWALHHGRPQPDFHDPACFTATLPPPPAP